MDFLRLVESGKYSEEDLNDGQRIFLNGMKWMAEGLPAFEEYYLSEHNIDEKVMDTVIEELKYFFKAEIAQAIVELADENAVKGELDDKNESSTIYGD